MAKIAFLKPRPLSDVEIGASTDPSSESPVTDPGRAARVGLWALAIGFGGFLLWAAVAPLDEGVPAQATVSIDTKRKAVQHLAGGIVREVLVREGQQVKEGQLLMKLDEVAARANYTASRQRYLGLRVVESRLLAERAGSARIAFHPDVVAESKDTGIALQMATQDQLMATRRAQLQADTASLSEQIRGQEQAVKAYGEILQARKSQLGILTEQLKSLKPLVAEGYAPRNQQSDVERSIADVDSAIADTTGNVLRAQSSIADLRQRITSRREEFRKDVETNLADVSREAVSEGGKLNSLKADLERTEIRSPATGQVIGLAVQSPGAVVSAGQKLMDIVPADELLVLEARVPPQYVDRIRAGLTVDVRFHAFANTPTLVVDGKVISVSSDLLTDAESRQAYYLARVGVTAEGHKELGKRQLQPGMPAEIVIRTGERSLLTYLVAPMVKRMAASMKEQ